MARTVHILRTISALVVLGAMVVASGCVIPPPIEPEPPENNLPPYLEPVEPETRITQVTSSAAFPLRVRLFDPNPEASLSVAWFGDKTGFIKTGRFPLQPTEELDRGIFFEFGQDSHELPTCNTALRFEETETIWVYVSDRQLDFPSPTTVDTEEGGFIESFSWLLELDPNRCEGAGGVL